MSVVDFLISYPLPSDAAGEIEYDVYVTRVDLQSKCVRAMRNKRISLVIYCIHEIYLTRLLSPAQHTNLGTYNVIYVSQNSDEPYKKCLR